MLGRAGQVVVLADADKFGRRLTYGVGRLGAGMQVVTDGRLSQDWRGRVADWGCGLSVAT